MTKSNDNLQGDEDSATALLFIDLINDLEFEGGERLADNLAAVIDNIVTLGKRAREVGIPVIYVNDNFGKWRSDFKELLDHCLHDNMRGTPFVKRIVPNRNDYVVLKPKHTGFFSTTLELLLSRLKVKTLILAGITTDQCILFTAGDAHVRDFRLIIPSDCVASQDNKLNQYALELMKRSLEADVRHSTDIDMEALRTHN